MIPDNDENLIRLGFGDGENGWAKDLGDNQAIIFNIPLESDLNIFDTVKIEIVEGRKRAGKVIEREYPFKGFARYSEPHQENYAKLVHAAKDQDARIEGMLPGMVSFAYRKSDDLTEIAEKSGVELNDIEIAIEPT